MALLAFFAGKPQRKDTQQTGNAFGIDDFAGSDKVLYLRHRHLHYLDLIRILCFKLAVLKLSSQVEMQVFGTVSRC